MAKGAVERARNYLTSNTAAGPHRADQLHLPMALAGGGEFTTLPVTKHFAFDVAIIRALLGRDSTATPRDEFVHAVTGVAAYDSLSGKQVDSHTAEFTLKMAGKAIGTTRRTVSKDGKTLTSTLKMTNEKGEKTENVTMFDKQ